MIILFTLPEYKMPDFSKKEFCLAPNIHTEPAPEDGILPNNFYATNIYPEYFKLDGVWQLIDAPRMDCVVVIKDGKPTATEARRVIVAVARRCLYPGLTPTPCRLDGDEGIGAVAQNEAGTCHRQRERGTETR